MNENIAVTPNGELKLMKIEARPFTEIDFLAESSDNIHIIDMIENCCSEPISIIYDEEIDYETKELLNSFLNVYHHLTTGFYILTINPADLIFLMYKDKIIGSYKDEYRYNPKIRNEDFYLIEQILILSASLKIRISCIDNAENLFEKVYTIRETLKAVNITIPETLQSHPAYSALNFVWKYDFIYRLNFARYMNSEESNNSKSSPFDDTPFP